MSPQLVYNKRDPENPITHRREQACVVEDGDFTRPNPNSKMVWQFEQQDVNGNGEFEIEEKMSRSLSAIAIKDELLFVSDVEGILHCLDQQTGKQHWGYDAQSTVYSTPLIVGEQVYLGTQDGEILVFGCSADLKTAAPHGEPLQRIKCGSSVNASVVADGNVLYFTTKNELIAVENRVTAKQVRGPAVVTPDDVTQNHQDSTEPARASGKAADPYDVLYDVIMTRYGPNGKAYGKNESSPSIFRGSDFPFGDKTYKNLNAALDAFAALPQTKIEAYSDIQRALMQRHLWQVFDATFPFRWMTRDPVSGKTSEVARSKSHSDRREAMRPRIASLIQRLALTKEQIEALPDTKAVTVESSVFATRHDPGDKFKPFLPADLYSKESSWAGSGFEGEPPAPIHSGKLNFRSAFVTFMRLPGGRSETVEYMKKITGQRNNREQFPVGTQFAFVEQAFLISEEGEMILSPLIVSISLRAYLDVERKPRRSSEPTQSVAEFIMQPRQLMQGNAVMKALGQRDLRFEAGDVDIHGDAVEPFEKSDGYVPSRRKDDILRIPRLHLCMNCHRSPGFKGVGGGAGLFGVKESSPEEIVKATLTYKHDDDTWRTLHEFWRADSSN